MEFTVSLGMGRLVELYDYVCMTWRRPRFSTFSMDEIRTMSRDMALISVLAYRDGILD